MKQVSEKLTLAQISKDMHALSDQFAQHSADDRLFQEDTKNTDMSIHETLLRIEGRIGGIEKKMDPEHDDYILRETNEKMDQLWTLFKGLSFAGSAIKYTAGVVAGISVIIVSLFALIRYVK